MERTCKKCKETKPLDKFHKSKRHSLGRKLECADCTNKYLNNHYHINSKNNLEFKRKRTDYNYKRTYGISYEKYLEMCKDRNYMCDICNDVKIPAGTSPIGSKDILVLDHCHETNKIRGILCQNCNQGIGLLRDNVDILTSAHLYLLQTETDKSKDSNEGY
jgi:hypothetical protein